MALLQCIYQLVQVQRHDHKVKMLTMFHRIGFNFTVANISHYIKNKLKRLKCD